MKKLPLLLSFLLLLIISGCNLNRPTCDKPYILVGNTCCLDQNSNSICDKEDVKEELFNEPATYQGNGNVIKCPSDFELHV